MDENQTTSHDLQCYLHNLDQRIREEKSLPPSDCHCGQCLPGWYFECSRCGHLKAWCLGASDDYPELCDHCWQEVFEMEFQVNE